MCHRGPTTLRRERARRGRRDGCEPVARRCSGGHRGRSRVRKLRRLDRVPREGLLRERARGQGLAETRNRGCEVGTRGGRAARARSLRPSRGSGRRRAGRGGLPVRVAGQVLPNRSLDIDHGCECPARAPRRVSNGWGVGLRRVLPRPLREPRRQRRAADRRARVAGRQSRRGTVSRRHGPRGRERLRSRHTSVRRRLP